MFGPRNGHSHDDRPAASALGWVSIAIGLSEVAAPRQIARMLGVESATAQGIIRILGVREICHGLDLLSHRDPTPGVLARVAGDVLDGVMLAAAAKKTTNPAGFLTAAAMVTPVVTADMAYATKLGGEKMLAS